MSRRFGGVGLRRNIRGSSGGGGAAAPVNTLAPVASGLTAVGSTLSTTDGTWTGTPAPTFTYQWQRAGVDIGGATASTYLTVIADAGTAVRCVVTGTNASGSASANSNAISMFAPTDIASLSWWLDEREQTDGGASALSAWGCQATALNDMAQGSGVLRLSLGRSINTYSAPEGPGGLARYIDTARNITQVLSASAFTVYFVVLADAITRLSSTDGTAANSIWQQTASGYLGLGLQIDGAGTGYRAVFTANDSGFKHVRSQDGSVSLATPTLIVVRLGGGAITVRVGAAAMVSTAFGAALNALGQTQGQRLGTNYAATAATGFDGLIGSVVGFNALITDGSANDLSMRSYLSTKYGCAV